VEVRVCTNQRLCLPSSLWYRPFLLHGNATHCDPLKIPQIGRNKITSSSFYLQSIFVGLTASVIVLACFRRGSDGTGMELTGGGGWGLAFTTWTGAVAVPNHHSGWNHHRSLISLGTRWLEGAGLRADIPSLWKRVLRCFTSPFQLQTSYKTLETYFPAGSKHIFSLGPS
jgi:hypothetical protein